MPESHQQIVGKAFSLLWARIYNPRSGSPDVELGFIEREMTQILESLGSKDGPPEERWILAQLLLGPKYLSVLQWSWAEVQDPRSPTPDDPAEFELFYADEDKRMKQDCEKITQAAEQLSSAGRVQWIEAEGAKQLRLP